MNQPVLAAEKRHRKGKREQNAEALRRRILRAARSLIGDIGYEQATISKIRQLADVSIATFYKYFDSKQAILIAILNDEREVYADAVAAAIAAPLESPVDYIVSIVMAALDPPPASHRAMWREILAASILITGDPTRVQDIEAEREFYSGQIRDGVRRLIEDNYLARTTPDKGIVDIVFCIGSLEFQEFVCERYEDRQAFVAHLRSTVDTLLTPWLVETRTCVSG